MKKITFCFLVTSMSINLTNGQFFEKLTNAVGSVVNTGVQITTAPATSIINAAKMVIPGSDASNIYKPYQQAAASAGVSISSVTGVVNAPQQYLTQKALEFASSTGQAGEFIFDVGTFSQRYYNELANAGANNISGILQGQNPFQIAAAPLAAAIRAAREKHYPNSYPIPEDVKNSLRNYFSESTLNNARYTIGNINITLANFIGQGQKFMGEDRYAVTVGDIIVFNNNPGSYQNSANWWAHEITHIQQYERLGIEKFAFEYMKDAGNSIEQEAVQYANSITNSNRPITSSSIKVGAFDMSGAQSSANYSQNPEYYIIQCVFPNDQFGVMYLITNYGRIIAVNPLDGTWLHIGYATPPRLSNVAWSYDLPNARWSYAVGLDGNIYNPTPIRDNFGQVMNYNWTIVGYTIRLR